MKIDKSIAKVICDLEEQIGSECFNPNSYDGWNDVEGCEFRYPVYINTSERDDSEIKTRGIAEAVKPEYVRSLKYKFGSNHLFIGLGIINVLRYLEKRYGLDFNELEKNAKDDNEGKQMKFI